MRSSRPVGYFFLELQGFHLKRHNQTLKKKSQMRQTLLAKVKGKSTEWVRRLPFVQTRKWGYSTRADVIGKEGERNADH